MTMHHDLKNTATLTNWLVAKRNAGTTPDEIAEELLAGGWDADSAARTALGSLRNTDRHRLIYAGLCWGAGLSALCIATAIHLMLAGAGTTMYQDDREYLAVMITTAVVLLPIAITCGVFANRIEREDPFAIWSPTRRWLFGLLATMTGIVGIYRLLGYTYSVIASLTGAGDALSGTQLAQVLVSLSIAIPLFVWSLLEWRRSNVAIRSLHHADSASAETTPSR